MIIGDGDIAQALKEVDRSDLIFFASGVSNSQETRTEEFDREKQLLFDTHFADEDKRIVYFGSLSIFYSDTPYARHKKKMEDYVKMFKNYTIIRLGNITFGNNPHTIINSMKAQKARGEELRIENTYRYVVGKEEFLYWIKMIPDFNVEINVPGERLTINELVKKYVA